LVAIALARAAPAGQKSSRQAMAPAGACITPMGATTIAWLLCANSGSLAETAE